MVNHDQDEESGFDSYSDGELLEQAQQNAQAAIIATVGFLYQRKIPLDDWASSLGETFAKAWTEPENWGADEFLDAMLTNYRSLGADVVSTDFTPDRAEAVTTGFPDPDLCDVFGVALPLVAHFNDAAAPLAERFGLRWEWHLDGDRTTYVVSRNQ